ncbi:MAG: S-adenosylmethionine decarboxylase [Nanoarchaeota archaeon]
MTEKKKVFGYELLVDCYGCKPGVCDDIAVCYDFLDQIVPFIEMEKQGEPAVFRTDEERFPGKNGLSGWVPLAESSIVIHTLSLNDYISLDVYSCKEFDINKVTDFVKKWFHPTNIDTQFVERGTKYFD